jgi:hypothetical protein
MRVRKIFQEWSATETADGDYQRNQILAINTEKLYRREEVLKGRDAGLFMVSAAGLEPATHALKGHCSTN